MKKKLEVLLLKKCGTGYQGDVISVKRGFARNFLFRNGFAVIMNDARTKEREKLIQAANIQKEEAKEQAEKFVLLLKDKTFTIKAAVDVKGGLYGSITSTKIVSLVNEFLEVTNITKKDVIMHAPIRSLGSHDIIVKLFKAGTVEVLGNVHLEIAPDVEYQIKDDENKQADKGEEANSETSEQAEISDAKEESSEE